MTHQDKVKLVRDNIVSGAVVYKELVGKYYLYVFENGFLEMYFGTDNLKMEDGTDDIYIPKSFRVNGKIFEKAEKDKIFEINYILSKTDKERKYNTILYKDNTKLEELDKIILDKIDLSILKE